MKYISYIVFGFAAVAAVILVALMHPQALSDPDFAVREFIPGVPNFARITPGIWRGQVPDSEGLKSLGCMGVKTIIDFREHGEHEGLAGSSIEYFRMPFSATDPPPEEIVDKFLTIVTDPDRQPVFFHCRYGKDRTGTMAALYRIRIQGWEPEKAVREMKYFGFRSVYRDLIGFVRSQEPSRMSRQDITFWATIHRFAKHLKLSVSSLDIEISPDKTTIAPTEGKSAGKKIMILSFPVTIKNNSESNLETKIAHEWYGGNWPPTDLYAYVTCDRTDVIEPFMSLFLVGETGGPTEPTVLKPGESVSISLRMDWPGTGSCPAVPLMDKKKSSTYQVRFILAFEADGRKQYIVSPEMQIHVKGLDESNSDK